MGKTNLARHNGLFPSVSGQIFIERSQLLPSEKRIRKLAQLKLCFASVQAFHPQTNLFLSVRAFCLASIAISAMPAHGEPPRPASAPATQGQRQVNNIGPAEPPAITLTVNNEKTRLNLRKGVTSFVIPLASPNQQRCFTLENEKITTKGTLSIATASRPLAANDASWNVVAGAVRFRQKRQFRLSLVGVDAKFVRLTFQIDGSGKTLQAR